MTTPADKKRTPRPLTATQAADKLSAMIKTRDARIAMAREKASNKAALDELASDERETERIMARVPESERPKVAAVLLALGHELCGMEVVAGNETEDAPDEPRGTTPYVPGPAARAAQGRGTR